MNNTNYWMHIEGVITIIARWCVYIAAVSAAVMMSIAIIDVIGSKLFQHGILGASEMIAELNIVLVFMALAYVQIDTGHIRITFLEKYVSYRMNYVLRLISHALSAFIFGFMSWRALVLLLKYIDSGTTKGGGVVHFPLWPFAAILLLGVALLTIVFIMLFIREIVRKTGKLPVNLQPGRQ